MPGVGAILDRKNELAEIAKEFKRCAFFLTVHQKNVCRYLATKEKKS